MVPFDHRKQASIFHVTLQPECTCSCLISISSAACAASAATWSSFVSCAELLAARLARRLDWVALQSSRNVIPLKLGNEQRSSQITLASTYVPWDRSSFSWLLLVASLCLACRCHLCFGHLAELLGVCCQHAYYWLCEMSAFSPAIT